MSDAIQSTQQAAQMMVDFMSGGGATATATATPPLMPEPQPMDVGGDPMAALYALMSKQRSNDMESGKAGVEHNRELQRAQQLKEEADLKKQEDAERNAKVWGIFGKIASVVAIAVSAVAAACSGGAASALCVAACVLSAAAFAEGEAHVITKLTNNPDAEKFFQMGCGIAAAACSGGAGLANLGANALAGAAQIAGAAAKIGQEVVSNATTDKGWQDVAMGLGIGGAVANLTGGLASAASAGAGAAKDAADDAEEVAKAGGEIGKGVAETAEGVATIGKSFCEADSVDAIADAKEAQMRIAHLQQLVTWAIDGVKETDKSHERALSTLQGAMQTKGQTLVIASSMRV